MEYLQERDIQTTSKLAMKILFQCPDEEDSSDDAICRTDSRFIQDSIPSKPSVRSDSNWNGSKIFLEYRGFGMACSVTTVRATALRILILFSSLLKMFFTVLYLTMYLCIYSGIYSTSIRDILTIYLCFFTIFFLGIHKIGLFSFSYAFYNILEKNYM